ncbi:PemK family transcriptional regulator [Candidatus Giovannonibacteria bacterium RIFCSPHIGHO2_01_FULL_48_47]|nr:MAG: PemK family transcriptional regulator [Candidatus Giovannonibacteria bacterium RIFCSPHIGHO2_01_FULL_48_47]OGF68712.1 MAG: PemK family transcriptional regulator [Candidatus Giovannonibacteria bacterium RIFCSPHIGHO2_02_FULL_48_15]OGF89628.1 MAG: PemK family transcriptional regulator [Candidatus Giovannonibacteria bacterium RIFCSPLOWO2_01_FULL_48_47]OGF95133.1 MAG: PemK family transcriptional regulator [Candidatus Giovannonibacteria bacterium RIFOXYC1_FULL_48_8]OGF96355.1 MAG: PemK family 
MIRPKKAAQPNRGEVWLVNFDPTVGAEIKKTRPALILQNDISNHFSAITIAAAITSQVSEYLYPTEIIIRAPEGGLKNDSIVLLNQIRSVDKLRLIKRTGILTPDTMRRVDLALQISLGLVKI